MEEGAQMTMLGNDPIMTQEALIALAQEVLQVGDEASLHAGRRLAAALLRHWQGAIWEEGHWGEWKKYDPLDPLRVFSAAAHRGFLAALVTANPIIVHVPGRDICLFSQAAHAHAVHHLAEPRYDPRADAWYCAMLPRLLAWVAHLPAAQRHAYTLAHYQEALCVGAGGIAATR